MVLMAKMRIYTTDNGNNPIEFMMFTEETYGKCIASQLASYYLAISHWLEIAATVKYRTYERVVAMLANEIQVRTNTSCIQN